MEVETLYFHFFFRRRIVMLLEYKTLLHMHWKIGIMKTRGIRIGGIYISLLKPCAHKFLKVIS